ncbi:lysophospholipid acyltransferase family protein [Paenalcaligenes hominis]|nr:lysophospholipid acyltransferase family protein [Paenalcaligenes hominis]GGE59743.1 1-acyl-sn-glycerol-3-phosphate acyltransferase [Paenalcaligenes hominis]
MLYLRALIYQLFMIITVIPYAFACLLWSPLPLHWRYRLTSGWPRLMIWGAKWILGLRWCMIGTEHLPDGAAVILSKHQSAWETLFFTAHMPRDVCFVYKRELNRIPFFGWGLALLRMIPINRAKGRDAFEQVVQLGQLRLNEGRWPLLFPEGTRVAPGKTIRYKQGGAALAVRCQAPVIPIAHNAGECWPRNSFIKKPGLITVSIGPLIPTEGRTATEVNKEVEAWIETEMRRLNPERYDTTST